MGANWTETSTGLKLLVITMTGLLVVGLILLAVGLARTAGALGRIVAADGVPAAAARPAQSFEGEFEIEIPAGTRLRSITATDDLLYLHVGGAGAADTIVVLDRRTGAGRARIILRPAP